MLLQPSIDDESLYYTWHEVTYSTLLIVITVFEVSFSREKRIWLTNTILNAHHYVNELYAVIIDSGDIDFQCSLYLRESTNSYFRSIILFTTREILLRTSGPITFSLYSFFCRSISTEDELLIFWSPSSRPYIRTSFIPIVSRTQINPLFPIIQQTPQSRFTKCCFNRFTRTQGTWTSTPFVNYSSKDQSSITFPYLGERVWSATEPILSTCCTSAYV